MKMTPVISCTILSSLTLGMVHEKSNVPPHNHQESQAEHGPNFKTLSFARNGAATRTQENVMSAGLPTFGATAVHLFIPGKSQS